MKLLPSVMLILCLVATLEGATLATATVNCLDGLPEYQFPTDPSGTVSDPHHAVFSTACLTIGVPSGEAEAFANYGTLETEVFTTGQAARAFASAAALATFSDQLTITGESGYGRARFWFDFSFGGFADPGDPGNSRSDFVLTFGGDTPLSAWAFNDSPFVRCTGGTGTECENFSLVSSFSLFKFGIAVPVSAILESRSYELAGAWGSARLRAIEVMGHPGSDIALQSDSGFDYTLEVTPIPEPGTLVTLGGGLALFLLVRSQRGRRA